MTVQKLGERERRPPNRDTLHCSTRSLRLRYITRERCPVGVIASSEVPISSRRLQQEMLFSRVSYATERFYIVNRGMLSCMGGEITEPSGTASATSSTMSSVLSAMSRVSNLECFARCVKSNRSVSRPACLKAYLHKLTCSRPRYGSPMVPF